MKKTLLNSLKVLITSFLISNAVFAQTNQTKEPINKLQEINKILQQSQESSQNPLTNREKVEKENKAVQPLEEKNTPIAKKNITTNQLYCKNPGSKQTW